MPGYITETRVYVGEQAVGVGDGYAGFRIGRQYQLTLEQRSDGLVAIVFNRHAYERTGGGAMVLPVAQFEKWFMQQ